MARSAYNVRRGMVFWYNPGVADKFNATAEDSRGVTRKSSVQAGHRPYVVVSCDEGNLTAPTCNIAPVTDEVKTKLPVHVDVYFNGRMNTVLLEQVITVDQYALKDYVCMFTDETLEKIERALTIQYSIRPSLLYGDFDLGNIIGSLEKIVTRIIENKTAMQQARPQATLAEVEDVAVKLGAMIEELVGVPEVKTEVKQDASVCDESQPIPEVQPQKSEQKPVVEKPKPKPTPQPVVKPQNKPVQNKTNGRMRWTDESRRQYLKDCDEMSPQEVADKYGFSTIKSVFQTKYMCKNILGVE